MRLVARKALKYAGRQLQVGDEFETRKDIHGKWLIAARRAALAVEKAPVEVQEQPRRRYKRRDMQAEELPVVVVSVSPEPVATVETTTHWPDQSESRTE